MVFIHRWAKLICGLLWYRHLAGPMYVCVCVTELLLWYFITGYHVTLMM